MLWQKKRHVQKRYLTTVCHLSYDQGLPCARSSTTPSLRGCKSLPRCGSTGPTAAARSNIFGASCSKTTGNTQGTNGVSLPQRQAETSDIIINLPEPLSTPRKTWTWNCTPPYGSSTAHFTELSRSRRKPATRIVAPRLLAPYHR